MQLTKKHRTNLLAGLALVAMLSLFVVNSLPYLIGAAVMGTAAGFLLHNVVRNALAPSSFFLIAGTLLLAGFAISAFFVSAVWLACATVLWAIAVSYMLKPIPPKR